MGREYEREDGMKADKTNPTDVEPEWSGHSDHSALINVSVCSNYFHNMKLEKFLNKVNVGNLQMCDIQEAVGRPDSI